MIESFPTELQITLPEKSNVKKSQNTLKEVLQKHSDEIIVHKNNVFELSSDFIEKYCVNQGTHQHVFNFQDDSNQLIKSYHYGRMSGPYDKFVLSTHNNQIIDSLGLNNVPHNYFGYDFEKKQLSYDTKGSQFVSVPDLSINGRFLVESLEKEHFKTLKNGNILEDFFMKKFQEIFDIYTQKYHDNKIRCEFDLHPTEKVLRGDTRNLRNNIKATVRHMFLVQVDESSGIGKLAVGDRDHIRFYKLK